MDKFESQFADCIHSLTKEESPGSGSDKDEIKVEVENTIANFIDLARQMECFFLQKRFQLSCLKPELLLKEENIDLRHEIARKDELLKKHSAKIAKWKEFLSDNPQPSIMPTGNQPPIGGPIPPPQNPAMAQVPPQMGPQMHPHPMPFGPRAGNFQAMGMGPMTNQNPLAFLEKTTNNLMDGGFNR
jgi:mediator of RNA polymerase II transcription subunit 28